MNLIVLHGPPATGKHTVGRRLARATGYPLFHNHLVVDALLAVFAFGSAPFVALREKFWRDVFLRAARRRMPGLIFTFTPEATVRPEFVRWLFRSLPRLGVRVISVELTAGGREIRRRLGAAGRRRFGKLTDPALYGRLRRAGAFASPRIPRRDLVVDTGRLTPAQAARRIRQFVAARQE